MAEQVHGFHALFATIVHTLLRALSFDDLRVLLVLLQHRNSRVGLAWPSVATIARLTFGEDSKSRVRRSLKRLEEQGLIRRRYQGGGRGERARWEILIQPMAHDDRAEKTGADSDETGATVTPKRGQTTGQTGAMDTPKRGQPLPPESQLTPIKESQLKRSMQERGDGDSPSVGFDFELELAEDKNKTGSPYDRLSDLDVSEAAIDNAYRYKELGRALALTILERYNKKSKTGMDHDAARYLGSCCWHPKPELVRAARQLRKSFQPPAPGPASDQPFQTRAQRKRVTVPPDDEHTDTHGDA